MLTKIFLYIFLLLLTLVVFFCSRWLFRKTGCALLHPLLSSMLIVILFLLLTGIPYIEYQRATLPIDFLLGPTVVALGYALWEQTSHLKKNLASIMVSIVMGSLVGIVSVIGVLYLFGSGGDIIASLMPKSVTNPIAIPLSERNGGIGGLTSVVVVMTGILGGIIGPPILKAMGVESKIAKGLAMGAAAHGVGTARAMEMGALEGAIAGLAIGLMGMMTAILVPIVWWIFW
ncbi:MAG: LrgB family protein [Mucinivorans sp.]